MFEQALALAGKIEFPDFYFCQRLGCKTQRNMHNNAGWYIGQLDEVPQTLRRLDDHQYSQTSANRAPLSTRERLLLWGGRVNIGKLARRDLWLETRIGRFVNTAHGLYPIAVSPSGIGIIPFNVYFI